MSNSKTTIPSNAVVIPVPEELRNRGDGGSRLYINTITIEGSKDHDKKLVIKHRPIYPASPNKIVVQLRGSNTVEAWEEFEAKELEAQYESNLVNILSAMNDGGGDRETTKRRDDYHYKSAYLYAYIRDYFLENENGKRIMELIRRKNQQLQQQLDGRGAPNYDKIVRESCEHIKAKYHIITIWEEDLMYYYKDGKYVQDAERIIAEECFALFQYDARSYMVEEIKKALKRQTYHNLDEFDADTNIINVKNGLYHIKEKTLTEHTPHYLSLVQKPIVYDPNAQCPVFRDVYLAGCLYPSQIETVLQCAAYTFYRDNPYEHYVIHVGYGWNGKTKLNNVMVRLHGEENVSYVAFNDISKDPYALADLERKALNIDNEPSGGIIKNTAILKKLSGRELIRVQQKYIKAHNVRLHAKLWFSTNDIPDIQDDSVGRFRREIVVMWPFTFKPNPNPNNPMEKQDDPDIEEKMTTEAELSGIFKLLMDVLYDILYKQKKRIHADMSNIEERRRHRQMLRNPVQEFVNEVIDLDNSSLDDSIRKDELHKIYEKFCELNKIAPEEKQVFGNKLKHVIGKDRPFDDKQREKTPDPVTGKRMTLYKGIKVRPGWLDETKRDKQTSLLTRIDEEEEETDKEQLPLSGLSGLSQQNDENKHSVQENNNGLSLETRSEITSDTEKNPVQNVSKPENAMTATTAMTKLMADYPIAEMIRKAMIDPNQDIYNSNKGYFTKDDWVFTTQMEPNLHWTENEAEEQLRTLAQKGKLEEFEPGKYRLKKLGGV